MPNGLKVVRGVTQGVTPRGAQMPYGWAFELRLSEVIRLGHPAWSAGEAGNEAGLREPSCCGLSLLVIWPVTRASVLPGG